MKVAIIGARSRKNQADAHKIEELVAKLMFDHGRRLIIYTVGCDLGIGKLVHDSCEKMAVDCVEYTAKFYHGKLGLSGALKNLEKNDVNRTMAGRLYALLHVGDEFHFFTVRNPDDMVGQIIPLAEQKVGPSRIHVYREGV